MAGESAHFGLRQRPPTPATHAFELPPRMQPMLDRGRAGLAEPFRGVATNGGIAPGLFALDKTGVSPAPLVAAAGAFFAALGGDAREAALALLCETLSAAGYQTARDVMRLNEHALEITHKPDEYSEWYYWV